MEGAICDVHYEYSYYILCSCRLHVCIFDYFAVEYLCVVLYNCHSGGSIQQLMMLADVFYIEPVTGVIRNKVDLAGLAGVYEMVVHAVDHGVPALTGIAYVTINVRDPQLKPPIWITPPTDDYAQYIREVTVSLM